MREWLKRILNLFRWRRSPPIAPRVEPLIATSNRETDESAAAHEQGVKISDAVQVVTAAEPPANAIANIYAAGLVPPVAIEPATPPPAQIATPIEPNRRRRRAMSAELRKFERARLKLDKFVEPKGPRPVPIERGSSSKKQPPAECPQYEFEEGDDDIMHAYIVGEHHSDRQTQVLYKPREFFGEFNFRDTILEQLPHYFMYLERMKKHDADSLAFYRQVGATLLPYSSVGDIVWYKEDTDREEYAHDHQISRWFCQTRPSFGCVAYGANPQIEKQEQEKGIKNGKRLLVPRFMYFTKYERGEAPPEIQPMKGGDIYKITVWWDDAKDKKRKHGTPQEFPLLVDDDGRLHILRTIQTDRLPIISKRYRTQHPASNGVCHIPYRQWQYPHHADDWAKLHHTSVRRLIGNLFADTVDRIERAAWSMIRITVINKNGDHVLFSLDPHRMSYFFQDRDFELTDSGRRKPIFHMVRPHTRKDGRAVGFQFRGQREFDWADYHVKITVPGKDHTMLEEINLGSTDIYWPKKEKMIHQPEYGRKLRAHMDGKELTKKGSLE